MGDSADGCARWRAEVEAFRQGFGHPGQLTAALRDAPVLLPVTPDDRLLISTVRGVDWLCVFTGEAQYAAYLDARGAAAFARYRALPGGRVLDEIAAALPRPTGVVVDAAGPTPMAFPPDTAPGAFLDPARAAR
ncbi:SseB family protein [Rhodococcus sp. NPDC058505]|uniref:SseB family protein n=1 Tax=Rhodococcus sp. NPDC058505 TaxID=3346531 RepID=UPI003648B704